MNNRITGNKGEEMAVAFLAKKGFTVLERNWRYQYVEIDIIASRDEVLHLIEVKTRTGTAFGLPEEGVTKKKMQQMKKGAEQYQWLHPEWKEVCFNVLAISIGRKGIEYWFNEDVYF